MPLSVVEPSHKNLVFQLGGMDVCVGFIGRLHHLDDKVNKGLSFDWAIGLIQDIEGAELNSPFDKLVRNVEALQNGHQRLFTPDHDGMYLEIWLQMSASNKEGEGNLLHHGVIQFGPLDDLTGEVNKMLVEPNFFHEDSTIDRQVHVQGVSNVRFS